MPEKAKKVAANDELRQRYTRVVKIAGKWNTYLQIDQQGFCVVEQTSLHRARWFAHNLAAALARLLSSHSQPSTLNQPINPAAFERLFESIGCKFVTVPSAGLPRPSRRPQPSTRNSQPPIVTHSHYEKRRRPK